MSQTSLRVALITGANKGIGLEIARQLGRAGYRVWLGARDPQRGSDAAALLRAEGWDVTSLVLDIDQPDSIAAAFEQVSAAGPLDVLVNNAGIAVQGDGPPSSAAIDAVRRSFETNFFGMLAVTQAMLPLIRRSTAGRIVNVSSGLASLHWNGDPEWAYAAVKYIGYNGSKVAVNMLTVQLAAELADTGIKVNAADPGYTATDLNGHSGHQTIPEGAAEAIRLALLPDDGPTGGFFSSAGANPW